MCGMNNLLRVSSILKICNSNITSSVLRYRSTPVMLCQLQRFRHIGHYRKIGMKNVAPVCQVFENVKSFKLYSTQNLPGKNIKDQTENILTVPNFLTVGRMIMCPILGYLVIQNDYPTAFGLFVIAGITDLLDGWIARTFPSQASLAGSFLDPLADKLLLGTLFVSLTYSGLIPLPLTILIVARDSLLVASGFYVRYISLEPPRTVGRYFDPSLATAQLAPTNISKFNTAVQLLLVACSLAVPAFNLAEPILPVLWYVTGTTTVLSGLSYVFAKNTYRIITRSRVK
ncbi:hypothetical protein GHT06_010657 [Daphnia sinensis]|uniref:cardiolipin synthase (CMP-forming) n=1 Tax=Daphnia sinensis TaxID=1820382 RepID=A0AAD5L0X3_9CRUS|nr:hypothetical protein GHT06_010657 [Daphnia sinensis]